jgi:prephenate dehydratase
VTRWGYLGPAGTFTEQALRRLPEADGAELIPFPTVLAALDAVRAGTLDGAMVPLENSVEGSVSITLDALAEGAPLIIRREVVLPVSFALLARPGTRPESIRTVAGHPHAQPQCRRWLAQNLPEAEWEPAASNADAAQAVAEGRWDAALAGAFAAPLYGLEVLVDGIHDREGAVTRFVLVTPPAAAGRPTGRDKTSLVIVPGDDHPGGLLEILTEFAIRGINLVRLESRPTGDGLGSYCFSLDAEGHIDEARMGEALRGLRRICSDVRYLGSYERSDAADAPEPFVPDQVTDAAFDRADRWLAGIRSAGTDSAGTDSAR